MTRSKGHAAFIFVIQVYKADGTHELTIGTWRSRAGALDRIKEYEAEDHAGRTFIAENIAFSEETLHDRFKEEKCSSS